MNRDLEAKPCVELMQVQLPERGVELKRLFGAQAAAQVGDGGMVLTLLEALEPRVQRCAHPLENRVIHPVQELVDRLRCLLDVRVVARLVFEERGDETQASRLSGG